MTVFSDSLYDFAVTLVCWIYFIFAFLFFFSIFYLLAFFCLSGNREQYFQYLNYLFFNGFLGILRFLAPRHKWDIDPEISAIRGSIIVCNHVSYLDPLLLISLLPRQKTIVKSRFFKAPVFGWLINVSGYMPSTTEGVHGQRMIKQLGGMKKFLQSGGNLFVFPEGTRNRDGGLGKFHKGVFKIGRMCGCPVQVLHLCNTEKLFAPGKFLFNTRVHNRIRLEVLACVGPTAESGRVPASELEREVRQIFESHVERREAVQ